SPGAMSHSSKNTRNLRPSWSSSSSRVASVRTQSLSAPVWHRNKSITSCDISHYVLACDVSPCDPTGGRSVIVNGSSRPLVLDQVGGVDSVLLVSVCLRPPHGLPV